MGDVLRFQKRNFKYFRKFRLNWTLWKFLKLKRLSKSRRLSSITTKRVLPPRKNTFARSDLASKFPEKPGKAPTSTKKCPFTGDVLIRGRILTGVVKKMKMQRTIIIRRDYLHFIKKYGRFEKRHTNMAVHLSPCFRDVELGDLVTVGECRPLSKTVRFNVVKHSKPPGAKKQFSKF